MVSTHKRCAIWLRVSTDEQAQGESPQTHAHRAQMYADLKEWEVVTTYDLCGHSGKTVLDHPEARRMLDDVRAGRIDALIFSRLARLARNVKELLEISELFKQHGAALVSLGESLDTSTPAGHLMFTVLGALAEWERNEISARVSASVPIRASQGKPTGGTGPWGYVWKDDGSGKRLVIEPEAAEKVKMVFGVLIEEGGNKLRTARRLNAMGVRTRYGAKWSVTGLKAIVTNPAYSGEKRANYSRSKGNKKSWAWKPEAEWITQQIEPILDAETWATVEGMLEKRSGYRGSLRIAPPKEPKFLYGGLLVCGCGQKIYKNHESPALGKRYGCRSCGRKAWESDISAALLESIRQIVVSPKAVEEAGGQETARYLEAAKRGDELLREAEKLRKKRDRILDLYADGGGAKASILAQLREMDARQGALEAEAETEALAARQIEAKRLCVGPLMDRAESLANMWGILTEDEQRRILKELVESITILEGEAVVTFYAGIPDT